VTQLELKQLPLWKELPSIELHLDQLLQLTNNYLKPITGEEITKTMMHNYFKAEIIVRPTKKHYQKIQLAGALIVGLLKSIFTLNEIQTGFQQVLVNTNPETGYNNFVRIFNQQIKLKKPPILNTEDPLVKLQFDAVQAILFWISARNRLLEKENNEIE
jgi:hypothetical protein